MKCPIKTATNGLDSILYQKLVEITTIKGMTEELMIMVNLDYSMQKH